MVCIACRGGLQQGLRSEFDREQCRQLGRRNCQRGFSASAKQRFAWVADRCRYSTVRSHLRVRGCMQPGRLEGYHEAHQLDSTLVDTDAMMTETKREERGREKARRCRPSLPLRSGRSFGQSLLEFSSIVFFAARGCGRSRDLGFGSEQTDTKNPSGFGAGARIRALQVTPHSRAARRETTNPARALRKNFNVPAHEDRDASICNVVSLVYVCAHERLSCEKNWRQRLRLDARFSVVALDHHRQN